MHNPDNNRLYFLDWIRIFAFFLLILYHTGMYYVCLLYTSPSPRDLSTSRMPSSA